MVEQSRLDAVFSALADPTRRAILARLARGPASVSEVATPFPVSLAAVSKHIQVLERAGLLSKEIDGRVHRCHLEAEPLREADAWIRRYRAFWEDRMDALARYLDATEESP